MTSTGFTVGLEGTRISSKVLKPPGGGSSDIFGMANGEPSVTKKFEETVNNEDKQSLPQAGVTQNRLFGSTDSSMTPKSYRMQSNVFGDFNNQQTSRSSQKKYVRHNPITGEVIEIVPKSDKEDDSTDQNEDEKEAAETIVPVQTSIRVRNPPGGKSSGIF